MLINFFFVKYISHFSKLATWEYRGSFLCRQSKAQGGVQWGRNEIWPLSSQLLNLSTSLVSITLSHLCVFVAERERESFKNVYCKKISVNIRYIKYTFTLFFYFYCYKQSLENRTIPDQPIQPKNRWPSQVSSLGWPWEPVNV